ncbi:MAG: hypothetical protein GY725_02345 [bacterium]|nr:hypothetical protein [bacterium]
MSARVRSGFAVLLLLALSATGCGHYGPPVRAEGHSVSTPAVEPAAETLDPDCKDEDKP